MKSQYFDFLQFCFYWHLGRDLGIKKQLMQINRRESNSFL